MGIDLPGACDVSDACDELGIAALRSGSLTPLWPGCPAVAGLVTTVRLEPAGAESDPLPELLDMLEGVDELVLVDLGGRLDYQCWGTVVATAARRHGIAGALVNGAARDVAGLRELGFPTYARGVHPASARGRLRLAAVGEPADLDGTLVESGSFAVADESGVVLLPARDAVAALDLARRRRQRELEDLRRESPPAGP
jgi:regulator of RNase E activity RraA